jgi:hypothetical protein
MVEVVHDGQERVVDRKMLVGEEGMQRKGKYMCQLDSRRDGQWRSH